jgi:hypothetical protein
MCSNSLLYVRHEPLDLGIPAIIQLAGTGCSGPAEQSLIVEEPGEATFYGPLTVLDKTPSPGQLSKGAGCGALCEVQPGVHKDVRGQWDLRIRGVYDPPEVISSPCTQLITASS